MCRAMNNVNPWTTLSGFNSRVVGLLVAAQVSCILAVATRTEFSHLTARTLAGL